MWNSIFFVVLSTLIFAGSGEQSFTPSEIIFPIRSIQLSTELSNNVPLGDIYNLYTCNDDDCNVTLFSDSFTDSDSASDNDSLYTLAKTDDIKSKPYRYLTISSCKTGESSFTATLKGEVNVEGTVYRTSTSLGLENQIAYDPESVSVTFNQRDCQQFYELNTDMDIADSQLLPLTLFLNITDISWVRIGVQTDESGCGQYGVEPNVKSVCLAYPHLIPIQSTSAPTIETYNIYNDGSASNTAGARVIFLIDSSTNDPIGGFTRVLYSSTSEQPQVDEDTNTEHFITSIKRITQTATGAYSFSTYSRYSDQTYLNFTNFSRSDHDSSTGTERAYTDYNSNSYQYAADKLD